MPTQKESEPPQYHFHPSLPKIPFAAPPSAAKKCDTHTCPWWPYSSSKDFKRNAGLILLIIFVAVICVIALNAAFRFIFQRQRNQNRGLEEGESNSKPGYNPDEAISEESPDLVFTSGMKLAGAEPECAICLSEFLEGEGIRVMENCSHGFHGLCIRKWLNSRSSCPVCRTICRPPVESEPIGI